MNTHEEMNKRASSTYYKFQAFITDQDGTKKPVGMAYLQEGQTIYTLRLWMFLSEKFFLVQSKDDYRTYLIMTREPAPVGNRTKYFWNIVGKATANAAQNIFEMSFDLFERKISLSIYPE